MAKRKTGLGKPKPNTNKTKKRIEKKYAMLEERAEKKKFCGK